MKINDGATLLYSKAIIQRKRESTHQQKYTAGKKKKEKKNDIHT